MKWIHGRLLDQVLKSVLRRCHKQFKISGEIIFMTVNVQLFEQL